MSEFFTNFPVINYNGQLARDITRRARFISGDGNRPLVFLPYTISEGEKPEDIAMGYYGDVSYTWLVLMANDIFDVYTQWPMTEDVFTAYLMKKYEKRSGETGYNVIEWTMNENIEDNVEFYYNDITNTKYSVDTARLSSNFDPDARAIRVHEYEFLMNEERRNIHLVDSRYKDKVRQELSDILR